MVDINRYALTALVVGVSSTATALAAFAILIAFVLNETGSNNRWLVLYTPIIVPVVTKIEILEHDEIPTLDIAACEQGSYISTIKLIGKLAGIARDPSGSVNPVSRL